MLLNSLKLISMNIKVRIVKDSKWLNRMIVLLIVIVAVSLSYELKNIINDPSVLLPIFVGGVLTAVVIKLLVDRKISVSDGYVEFNGESIFIHSGSSIYVANWNSMKKDDLIYNGDAMNLYCCSVGNKSTLKIVGDTEMSFQLHFPSRAYYVGIISFIDKLKLVEAHQALLVKHPDMYKYMTALDKLPGVTGGLIPLLVESHPEPEKNLRLLPNYSFSPSVKKVPFQ